MAIIRTPLYERAPRIDARQLTVTGHLLTVDQANVLVVPMLEDEQARSRERDDYLTKLLKYVPVEITAVFLAIAGLASQVDINSQTDPNAPAAKYDVPLLGIYETTALGWMFWVFLLLTPLFFHQLSRGYAEKNKPKWWFYALSMPAFAIWAMALNDDVRRYLDRGPAAAELLLALGAFLIPALDQICTAFFMRGAIEPEAE